MSAQTSEGVMNWTRISSVVATTVAAVCVVGCGSSGTQLSTKNTTSTAPGSTVATPPSVPTGLPANYNPHIDPSQFTNHVTNKYFPLKPGRTLIYVGVRDGAPTRHVFAVTHQTRTVLGVKCLVISDVVTSNGSLVEKTTDWYAQDTSGNVWYFGENTAEYVNGVVTTTAGTWEAGVDKAKAGIVMPATPTVGKVYRQEYRPGVALDVARIISLNATATVPAGTYRHLVVTDDINPLDPSKREHKWYAAGIGFVRAVLKGGGHSETVQLKQILG
jgi:hypothetical protein